MPALPREPRRAVAIPREFDLPEPDADARAHSARVAAPFARRSSASGGLAVVRRYMQLVLYAPGLGYYVAGARKFGAAGDFVTAPGDDAAVRRDDRCRQVGAILDAHGRRDIVEFGAGSGRLAADLLHALADARCAPRAIGSSR